MRSLVVLITYFPKNFQEGIYIWEGAKPGYINDEVGTNILLKEYNSDVRSMATRVPIKHAK